jgi:hypothetical protein
MKIRETILPHQPYAHVKIIFITKLECFFLKNLWHGLGRLWRRFSWLEKNGWARPVLSKSTNTIRTSSLDRSRRVDQDSYVERPNRSPGERYMPSGRSARPASHTGLTGLTGAPESEPK